MQQPSRGPRQSTLRRLLIVFGFGLVGARFFSPVSLNLWWLQPAILHDPVDRGSHRLADRAQ